MINLLKRFWIDKVCLVILILFTQGGIGKGQIIFPPIRPTPGAINNPAQTVVFNTIPAELTTTAAGNCTNPAYQWQMSYDNVGFNDISGATAANYQPPAVVTPVVYYRRLVRCGGVGGVTLGTAYSTNIATILASAVPYGVTAPSENAGDDNANMNWVLSKSYDWNGKVIEETKSFYNYSGQFLQAQNKVKYRKSDNEVYTHVMASQVIFDSYGRPALNTLSAPIDNSEFKYKPSFVTAPGGDRYTFRNFDYFIAPLSSGGLGGGIYLPTDNTKTPVPVGVQKGTLGWYYSAMNVWEPYVASTAFPYNRQTVYKDGTGNVREEAGVGEAFKMGSGHEAKSYVMPVANELDHYLSVRSRFFSESEMGNRPVSISEGAIQTISKDANGREVISIADKTGNLLMTARPGSELTVSNEVKIGGTPYESSFDLNVFGYDNYLMSGNGGNIKIYKYSNTAGVSPTLFYSGAANATILFVREAGYYYKVVSEQPFSINLLGRQGGFFPIYLPACLNCTVVQKNNRNVYYLKISSETNVSISGIDWSLYNLEVSPDIQVSFSSGGVLSPGYYKFVAGDHPVTINYSSGFKDVAYKFYNQIGQVTADIAPNGVKMLYGTLINNYSSKEQVPYISLNEYNVQGRLVKSKETDADGPSELVYRRDGKVRFSRNANQAQTGKFNYSNYDAAGRLIEAGEYEPAAGGIAFNSDMTVSSSMKDILESTSANGGLINGILRDVVRTYYDATDNSHNISGYVQDESTIAGSVSRTVKYSLINASGVAVVSQTWFNYDEEGKVLWEIKYIEGLGYKTTDYSYDLSGTLIKKVFQKNVSTETFVHYFDYDSETKKLRRIYTNTADNEATKQLQATYIYYLHGPVKRVELAGNLQGIDFTYTAQGMLKAVNNANSAADPGGDGVSGSSYLPDAFGMVLDYYNQDYTNVKSGLAVLNGVNTSGIVSEESYAGQLKAMTWFTKKPATVTGLDAPSTYLFKYDDKYQFTESIWGHAIDFGVKPASFTGTSYNKESVLNPSTGAAAYDANGNILYLQRRDNAGSLSDNFAYAYAPNTNRLSSVASVGGANYATYSYDKLGQLSYEGRGALSKYISYDAAGKVLSVARDAGFTQKVADFVYDETGGRVAKKTYNASFQLQEVTYYINGVVYRRDVLANTPAMAIEYGVDAAVGRLGLFYKQANTYAYQLTDHLGNVRAVITKNNSNYDVKAYSDYYPFGMTLRSASSGYRYGFQGQFSEKDGETDWNAFQLRMYDSRIARWLSIDPAKQFYSPYIGLGNNPVTGADKDGGTVKDIIVKDTKGNELFTLDDGRKEITTITTKELYARKIQWFEPLADNYMKIKSMNPNIGTLETIKHFTWDDIINFALRFPYPYAFRGKGEGDWKYVSEGGNESLMSTVDNFPYWTDAVGQIPFAISTYRYFKGKGSGHAIADVVKAGIDYGTGQIFGGDPDFSNTYDNYMVLRGAFWASKAYHLTGHISSGHYSSPVFQRNDYSAAKLGNSITASMANNWLNMLQRK